MPDLRRSEQIILDALAHAAEHNLPCPINMDLEMMIGADSTSTASWIIARLEEKGLIKVERFQRFRVVEIVATGKRTARSPSMHTERPHVPRGVRSGSHYTDRKLYRKGLA